MENKENLEHRKRYGQYFSGNEIADKLFSLLPSQKKWQSIIDPMAGTGDMFSAILKHNNKTENILGIEIDENVSKECQKRFPDLHIITEDAFKCPDIITKKGWDLVITNPPYIRYQLQNINDGIMPPAKAIRENLIKQISNIQYLSPKEKELFINLAKNYSGLADIAVPAWLLCAAMVQVGGYLALVVPETWLNRDYATPIQYMLLKCFQIETIAKNNSAYSFDKALVKTSLIIAKRTIIRNLKNTENEKTRIIEYDKDYLIPTLSLFPNLRKQKLENKWILNEDNETLNNNVKLPYEFLEIINEYTKKEFIHITDLDISFGQGLRTGANDFFYLNKVEELEETYKVLSNDWDNGGNYYSLNKKDTILALQNRKEISGLIVTAKLLSKIIIYPQEKLINDIEKYINAAERFTDSKGRHFKDYSAVKPNEKKEGDIIIRNWYQLPKLAPRHLPNLCITRVSSTIPECLFIKQTQEQPIVVDANMVTLWSNNTKTIHIMLALLNSTWNKLFLESTCTILGGGALKIEASHINKITFPKFSEEEYNLLEIEGNNIINTGKVTDSIQNSIDSIIANSLNDETITNKLRKVLLRKYTERSIK